MTDTNDTTLASLAKKKGGISEVELDSIMSNMEKKRGGTKL